MTPINICHSERGEESHGSPQGDPCNAWVVPRRNVGVLPRDSSSFRQVGTPQNDKRSGKMGKRKNLLIVLVISVIILGMIGWKVWSLYCLRQTDGWKDANPTKEQVDRWLLKDFDSADYKIWNKNPKFEGRDFDTGEISGQETYLAPLGEDDWAISGFAWGNDVLTKKVRSYVVKESRLAKKNGEIFISIRHNKKNQYGVGALLQGWAHVGSPPFKHRVPPPLSTSGKKIVLSFDVKIEKTIPDDNAEAWQFIGSTIWFNSVDLKKRAAMDLMVYANQDTLHTENVAIIYHQPKIEPKAFRPFVLQAENPTPVYRYQKIVVFDQREAFGKWQHYNIDVSWFVADMLKRFDIEYAAPSLELKSFDILCETMFGECGFYTKNVYLYYK